MSLERRLKDSLKDSLIDRDLYKKALSEINVLYKNQAKNLFIVHHIIDSMSYLPNINKVYLSIIDIVLDVTEAENCSLMLLDRETNSLVIKAAKGRKDERGRYYDQKDYIGKRFKIGEGIAGIVAKEGKPLLIKNTKREKAFIAIGGHSQDVKSLLCEPIFKNNKVIGVFNLSGSKPGVIKENNKIILRIISNLISTVLISANLFEVLQQLNETLEERVKEQTEKVRAFEDKYRALVQNANDGIFILQDSVFKFANPKFKEMVGYSEKELSSKNFNDIFFPDHLGLFSLKMEGKLTEKELPSQYELTAVRKDGSKLELEVSTAFINYEGNKAIQGIIRDITPRKELERLKSNFLATAAHEFRTPITIIAGYNNTLLKEDAGPLNDIQRQILKNSKISCDYVKKFAIEILDLSKIESGKMEMNINEVEIIECIENVLGQMRNLACKKGVKFEKKFSQNLPKVPIDQNKIEQVLINLIANALSFTPKGGIIKVGTKAPSSDFIEGYVTDNGIGISNEEVNIIFDEFSVSKRVKNDERIGLGLCICKKIVEAHRGRIWVEPGKNKGSKFTFVLPLISKYNETKG
jgi:PAS domain S-box-containing protein